MPLSDRSLVVASRTHFDGLLVDAAARAGAELAGVRVADIDVREGEVRLAMSDGRTRVAAFVVGADGANSLVRRRMVGGWRRHQLSLATGYFARGITSDEIVVEILTDPPGYIWSFPRPDHLAVGICTRADSGITTASLRAHVLAWIRATGIAGNAPLHPYSWPIPSLGATELPTVQIAGARWLTVGDAAGLVDSITREGIFFALQSAELAADALSTAGEGDVAGRFSDRVRSDIGAELRRAARLEPLFFHPRFAGLLLKALNRSAGIRAVLADLVAGAQSYRGLKWRLASTCEVRLAFEALTTLRGGYDRRAK